MFVEAAAVHGYASQPAQLFEREDQRGRNELQLMEAAQIVLLRLVAFQRVDGAAKLRERGDDLVITQHLAPGRAFRLAQLQRV